MSFNAEMILRIDLIKQIYTRIPFACENGHGTLKVYTYLF